MGESDDLESPGFRIFLHAQLLEGIQGIPVPWSVLNCVPHRAEFDHLTITTINPAEQGPASLVRKPAFQVFPHPIHHEARDSKGQNLRR